MSVTVFVTTPFFICVSGRVAHLSSFSYATPTEGAPSLRSLQGWVAMLPTQLFFFRTNSVAHASVVPVLCTLRKGRGTRGCGYFCSLKAGPPASPQAGPSHLSRSVRIISNLFVGVDVEIRLSGGWQGEPRRRCNAPHYAERRHDSDPDSCRPSRLVSWRVPL